LVHRFDPSVESVKASFCIATERKITVLRSKPGFEDLDLLGGFYFLHNEGEFRGD
jgi:hypothetical protein